MPRKAKDGIEKKAATAAVKTAAASSNGHKPRTLTLSNGIVLGLKPVPQVMLRDAMSHVEKPTPPPWLNPQRGEEEPNELDPGYLEEMEDYAGAVFLAGGKVALVMGTTCVSVPEGMFRPEDGEWVEWAKFAGAEPDVSSVPARYLAWLEYHALSTDADQSAAVMAPLMAASLSEQEVEDAVRSFRDRKAQGADRDTSLAPATDDGDHVPEAVAGDRPGDRGAGGGDLGDGAVAGVEDTAARGAP